MEEEVASLGEIKLVAIEGWCGSERNGSQSNGGGAVVLRGTIVGISFRVEHSRG